MSRPCVVSRESPESAPNGAYTLDRTIRTVLLVGSNGSFRCPLYMGLPHIHGVRIATCSAVRSSAGTEPLSTDRLRLEARGEVGDQGPALRDRLLYGWEGQ